MAGGLTKGKSHAKGGIKMKVKSTGQNIEVEGGEGIINKHTMSSKDKHTYEGKEMTACEIASDLNQKTGNGVSFDCDETDNTDMTPTDQSTGFAKGGKTKRKYKKKKMAKSKKKTGAYAKLVSKIMKRDGIPYREAQKKAKDEYVSGATSQKKKPKKTYKGRVDNLKSKSATKISYSGRPKKAKGGELMDADTQVDYAKGGEVWVNELGDYNEVEGRKIAKAENEWYKESDQSELTAKYENGKVNVYLNESLAEDYAKVGKTRKSPFKVNDMVYSYQNPNDKMRVSHFRDNGVVDGVDYGWSYSVALKTDGDGNYNPKGKYSKSSKWMSQNSMSKTKKDKYAKGGKTDEVVYLLKDYGYKGKRGDKIKVSSVDRGLDVVIGSPADKSKMRDFQKNKLFEYEIEDTSSLPVTMSEGGELMDADTQVDYAKGGDVMSRESIVEILKDTLEPVADEIEAEFETYNSNGEEVEYKSRDGFIPFTDGGYEYDLFGTMSMLIGSGKSLPTKALDEEIERQDNYIYELAQEYIFDTYSDDEDFIERFPSKEEINYLDLENYDSNIAEEFDSYRYDSDDSVLFGVSAYYYTPDNYRGVEGNHTIRLTGYVNLESPYHRRGKFEDAKEILFKFNSLSDLESRMTENAKYLEDWFLGSDYNKSTKSLYAKGGELMDADTQVDYAKGGKTTGGGLKEEDNSESNLRKELKSGKITQNQFSLRSKARELNVPTYSHLFEMKKPFAKGGKIDWESNSPKIYVASLSDYNAGRLEGEWFDFDQYDDEIDLMTAIEDMLDALNEKYKDGENREEWAVHDHEYTYGIIGEYSGEKDFEKVYALKEAVEESGLPFEVLTKRIADTRQEVYEVGDDYYGAYDSEEDFADQLKDETGISSEQASYYVYCDEVTARVVAGEQADTDVYGGNYDDDDILEMTNMEDEYEEADDDDKEDVLDEAKDKLYNEIYDEWNRGLRDDAVDFLVSEQGIYSEEDVVNLNWLSFDLQKWTRDLMMDFSSYYNEEDGMYYIFKN